MQPQVAAHIVPNTVLNRALTTQGLFTGRGGEHLHAALSQWLRGAGFPDTFQAVSVDETALTGAAAAAGEVLEQMAAYVPGTYGGAARVWPTLGVPAPGPGSGTRPSSLSGLQRRLGTLSSPTTGTVVAAGGIALLAGLVVGFVVGGGLVGVAFTHED